MNALERQPDCARRLRQALARAEPQLRSIPEHVAAEPRSPGKWSPKQIIGHLIDSASNNHQRFVRSLLQDEMIFPGYEQEQWVELQRYQQAQWSELLTLWAAFNRHIAVVMDAAPAEARLRVRARHNLDVLATRPPATPSDATLDNFMHDYVDHLELHVRQILGTSWTSLTNGTT